MGRSKSSTDIKDGYKWCPHCDGWTVCKCGSCGVKKPYFASDGTQKDIITEEGICKVCNGTGQIPK